MDENKSLADVNANPETRTSVEEPTEENSLVQEAELEYETKHLSLSTTDENDNFNSQENETDTELNAESTNIEGAGADNSEPEEIEPWFNKEKVYKEKVAPLMKKIIKICAMEDIPFFFASCIKDDSKQSKYIKELVSPTTHQLNLSQDLFPNFIAVTLGFNTIPPIKKTEFVFDVLEEDNNE